MYTASNINQVKVKRLTDLLKISQLIPSSRNDILDRLLKYINTYDFVWVSLKRLADETGWSKRTVSTALDFWAKSGLLLKKRRFNRTSFYMINTHLIYDYLNDNIRAALSFTYESFNHLPKALLKASKAMSCNLKSYIKFIYVKSSSKVVNKIENLVVKERNKKENPVLVKKFEINIPKREQESSTHTQGVEESMIKKSEDELRREFHERLSKEKGIEYADAYLLKMKSTGTMEKVSADFGRPRCSMSIEEQLRAENPDNPARVEKLLKIWKRIR